MTEKGNGETWAMMKIGIKRNFARIKIKKIVDVAKLRRRCFYRMSSSNLLGRINKHSGGCLGFQVEGFSPPSHTYKTWHRRGYPSTGHIDDEALTSVGSQAGFFMSEVKGHRLSKTL
uniref:Uncharacterized protein n=1 Tax=Romanomermis culicivorax TaxID=13658 RepID=A0A915ICW5_ROMCU